MKRGDHTFLLTDRGEAGFSLIELLLCLILTLILLGAAVMAFSNALAGRSYQAARTDAIVSAEAAINIMSREIGNSGYGLLTNGLVVGDSTSSRIHMRSNVSNNDFATDDQNEDVTFYCNVCSASGGSVVRYDAYNGGSTSGIINSVSNVQFQYWDYNEITHSVTGPFNVPTLSTGRVTITLTVVLSNVHGAPAGSTSNVAVRSDVTLRNSPYMLNRY
ncbi:MAG: prepilin-type N-terminal cleavage/methylation domain-containing protein [bacterium]|nr:prepilin-type N-terminal cleavage/methylation domain-containing protein [bacterium]